MLFGAAALALPRHLVGSSSLEPLSVRVASNPGVENAALQQLMVDRGFARQLALDITIVERKDVAGPIAALEQGAADLCMVSAYAGVLPAIEAGEPIRLIGSALQVPALAVFSADPSLRSVGDLVGRRIGIGERNGLLHLVMLALLRRAGLDPQCVEFVVIGGNAQVFQAIVSGAVDAGPCGVANRSDRRARIVAGGELWHVLPEFTYQLAYASRQGLATRGPAVARCLAAYALLFRYLSGAGSREAYLAAREKVGGNREEGDEMWRFIQRVQPYSRFPSLSPAHLRYLQELNLAAGLQHRVLPFATIADTGPATAARRLL